MCLEEAGSREKNLRKSLAEQKRVLESKRRRKAALYALFYTAVWELFDARPVSTVFGRCVDAVDSGLRRASETSP